MKTKIEHISNQMADFVIDRDVFGQVKSMDVSLIKRSNKPINAPELKLRYASLATRSIATFVDLILVVNILIVIETFFFSSGFPNMEIYKFRIFVGILTWIFYHGILESSVFQATLGEIVFKLKLVDLFGKKVGFLRATLRCVSTILSILPFGFGIWYITTDPKKRSWHDLIAGTFVIKQ